MSAESVGQIGLDLVVNQKQFNKQMTGIQSLAKKAGVALAGAFAVDKLVKFGKECINLGSDLAEVQNVVDVTFPKMSAQVDEFAKKSASAFGLSETMAKQYTGTLGSMAKAFGFSEEQAFNMGSSLAGLAGDVASFYNLSQDEAYTKLKSVFTGETESLKDLGVVMTQTALDSYAMSHGFGKVTSAMSEAEKVALRYAFVQDRLSAASGDFIRTSDSWSNQMKVLNLQFESIKATIGQGLIAAFTPMLQLINQLIAKLQVLATAFKDLMEGLFGKQEDDAFSSAADATSSMESSTGATAENLKKASRFLAGFDAINKASSSSSSSGSGSAGTENLNVVSGIDWSKVNQGTETETTGIMAKFEGLLTYMKEKFTPTFEKTWSKLSGPIADFKSNFSVVFGDLQTLAQPFTEYLKGPFCEYISSSFDLASTKAAGMLDSFNKVFGDIWNIAAFPLLEKFTTEWLPGFTEFGTKLNGLSEEIFGEFKREFDTIWTEALSPLLEKVVGMFTDFMSLLEEFWNEWGEPIFSKLEEAVSKTGEAFDVWWNNFLKPTFDSLMAAADEIWNEHLSPLLSNFLDMIGELVDGALVIYNQFIVPIVDEMSKKFKPVWDFVIVYVKDLINGLLDTLNGLITAFKGIIQFIVGVFTGDWQKAWDGIKNIFKGVFDSLVALVKTPVNKIIDIINGMVSGVVKGINTVIKAINNISFDMPDWLGGGHVGFNLKTVTAPKIPKLAEGGFVKANTPQLAIIGDNRHQGEVVAPEDKLREMAMQAVREAGAGGGITKDDLERIINNAVLRIVSALYELGFNIDGELMAKAEKLVKQGLDRRYNTAEIS